MEINEQFVLVLFYLLFLKLRFLKNRKRKLMLIFIVLIELRYSLIIFF